MSYYLVTDGLTTNTPEMPANGGVLVIQTVLDCWGGTISGLCLEF